MPAPTSPTPGSANSTVAEAGTWRLHPTPTKVPIAREGAAYAIDEPGDRLLLFGGLTGDTTLADVWIADLSRPGRPRWQQLCSPASCGAGPSARWGAHAVFDGAAERLVVFGGLDATGAAKQDVWVLDLTGTPTWLELAPEGPLPAARWSAAYGLDPVRRRMVVFGGQTGPDASSTSLQDTWALSLDGPTSWTELAAVGTTAGRTTQPGRRGSPPRRARRARRRHGLHPVDR